MKTLIAYEVAVELVQELRPIVETIKQHDSNLADQMKRAATSVVLNLSGVAPSAPAVGALADVHHVGWPAARRLPSRFGRVRFAGPKLRATCKLEHERAIVELFLELILERGTHLAPSGHRFSIELEPYAVLDVVWIGAGFWPVALLATGHHLLDLAKTAASRMFEPAVFRFGFGNTRQLASYRERDLAAGESSFELW